MNTYRGRPVLATVRPSYSPWGYRTGGECVVGRCIDSMSSGSSAADIELFLDAANKFIYRCGHTPPHRWDPATRKSIFRPRYEKFCEDSRARSRRFGRHSGGVPEST
jgi:hypothetical protein